MAALEYKAWRQEGQLKGRFITHKMENDDDFGRQRVGDGIETQDEGVGVTE